jgi:hypothetical protein
MKYKPPIMGSAVNLVFPSPGVSEETPVEQIDWDAAHAQALRRLEEIVPELRGVTVHHLLVRPRGTSSLEVRISQQETLEQGFENSMSRWLGVLLRGAAYRLLSWYYCLACPARIIPR